MQSMPASAWKAQSDANNHYVTDLHLGNLYVASDANIVEYESSNVGHPRHLLEKARDHRLLDQELS